MGTPLVQLGHSIRPYRSPLHPRLRLPDNEHENSWFVFGLVFWFWVWAVQVSLAVGTAGIVFSSNSKRAHAESAKTKQNWLAYEAKA